MDDDADLRAILYERFAARRPEIAETLFTRTLALDDSGAAPDAEYTDNLRLAVAAALDYALAVVRLGSERAPPVPALLLVQARLAARNGVSLDTVLRRYVAGYALFHEILLEAARDAGLLEVSALTFLTRSHAKLLDRLLLAVCREHTEETRSRRNSKDKRRVAHVEALLAGERFDTADLGYDFEMCHLGVVAAGRDVIEVIGELTAAVDCHKLIVRRGERNVWAWLGSRDRPDVAALAHLASSNWPQKAALAIGEPAAGLAGWRMTHRQAAAALPVALRSPDGPVARYAEVALLASAMQDDLLVTSLRHLYLEPLMHGRNGGEVLRQTLRAYFAARCNASSAASALQVSRQAVTKRLHVIEDRLGRTVDSCAVELETALEVDLLGEPLISPESNG